MPKQGSRTVRNQLADPRLPALLAEKAEAIIDNDLNKAIMAKLAEKIKINSTPVNVIRELECIMGDIRDFSLQTILGAVDEKYGRSIKAISDGAVRAPNR